VTTNAYEELSAKYIDDAERLLLAQDLPQASEKFWGAVAQMIKAVAVAKGWRRTSHGALRDVIRKLYRESEDEEFVSLMRSAERLHANFYEDNLEQDVVGVFGGQSQQLIKKLQALV
jgi:Archaeal PaREP1/PaREP8 family